MDMPIHIGGMIEHPTGGMIACIPREESRPHPFNRWQAACKPNLLDRAG